jgi:hypothetical protein
MNFQEVLTLHFPGTISEADYVSKTYEVLSFQGFYRKNSIPCVGVCRDEITRSFVDRIQTVWGNAFNFSGLGGMLFLGKTGFFAAHQHAPIELEREHYVYFTMAHIAIDEQGEMGNCQRPGRSEVSGACGALIAFRKEMLEGRLKLELDPDDMEQSLLKYRLFRKIEYGNLPDLVTLTHIAHKVILEDLEHLIEETVDYKVNDFAVLSGIQIHGPSRKQYIWPGAMYAVVNGQKKELVINAPS